MSTRPEGIPETIPRAQVVAGIRAMGIEPGDVREIHWDAAGEIRVTVFRTDPAGNRLFDKDTEETITDDWIIHMVDGR